MITIWAQMEYLNYKKEDNKLGVYRLILALLVLLSHCGYQFIGYNQGVTAVVSFFIISGYVITKLINAKFRGVDCITLFYIDRAMRLFPQFVFYLALTSFLYIAFDGIEKLSISQFLVNLSILPLNGFAVFMNDYIIVPQSWSLGLELQFYLLIPFILLSGKSFLFSIVSLVLFVPAYLGIINTDYFGYRMISGTLFIFLIGNLMAERKFKLMISLYALSLAFFIASFFTELHTYSFNKEVLSGILIGVPIVFALFKINIKNNIDKLAGDLSYGVYLNHLMFFYAFNKMGFNVISVSGVLLIMSSSILSSYISLRLIEQPFYRLRHEKNFFLRFKQQS
ncbi:acyltransferase [Citrobacter sp. FDAARGOS_156]|uniref:acyltransferase family protein n=1 Tax=Citrobacter sp. FDAARGOS_156 TaxID=1702170 RepID=UPI00076B6913|nr:acyltransferase [Citrobacter sp. FDAARGOS_156]AMH16006.1 acyltransferase [Citrobacter sp. FDAARGOS_156]